MLTQNHLHTHDATGMYSQGIHILWEFELPQATFLILLVG